MVTKLFERGRAFDRFFVKLIEKLLTLKLTYLRILKSQLAIERHVVVSVALVDLELSMLVQDICGFANKEGALDAALFRVRFRFVGLGFYLVVHFIQLILSLLDNARNTELEPLVVNVFILIFSMNGGLHYFTESHHFDVII